MASSTIVFGCSVAVLSSAIQSLGITLQRKSHIISNQIHLHQKRQRLWLTGFLLFIVANVLGSLIQISTLPLIILSPLQSIGLIFNSILSCVILDEVFTRKLGVGTAIIAVCAFIIAYNGSIDIPTTSLPIIIEKLQNPKFKFWFISTLIFCLILLFVNKFVVKRYVGNYKFVQGINYGIISGTLTAHTFLFAKSIIDVILQSILNKSNIFKNFTPYLLLIIMLVIIGLQLTAFNLALSKISTSILYPLCFLVYNLFNLINDLIFNKLLPTKMSYWQLNWIIMGLIGVLIGVILISWDGACCNEEPQTLTEEVEVVDYGLFKLHNRVLSFEQNQVLNSMGK